MRVCASCMVRRMVFQVVMNGQFLCFQSLLALGAVNKILSQAEVEFVGGQGDRKFGITHLLGNERHTWRRRL